MLYDLWTMEDALALRCPMSYVGCVKAVSDATADDVQALARSYAPRMLRNLARIAEGGGLAAVRAAQAILQLAATAPAPGAGGLPAPPPWLDEQARLSYAAGRPALSDANVHASHANAQHLRATRASASAQREGVRSGGSTPPPKHSSVAQTDSPQDHPPLIEDADEHEPE